MYFLVVVKGSGRGETVFVQKNVQKLIVFSGPFFLFYFRFILEELEDSLLLKGLPARKRIHGHSVFLRNMKRAVVEIEQQIFGPNVKDVALHLI